MGLIVASLSVSLDGFVAGPNQSLDNPLGENVGQRLHRWMFEDADNNVEEQSALTKHSAYIMGRNMFGPVRGPWVGDWNGWWGDNPPYHAPVFVLTHVPREPLVMAGGTSFTFVTDGIEAALAAAQAAAGDGSISIAGGAATVRQYLRAGVIDELRLQIAPVVLGAGETLLGGLTELELEPLSSRHTRYTTHIRYRVLRPKR